MAIIHRKLRVETDDGKRQILRDAFFYHAEEIKRHEKEVSHGKD